VINLQTKTRRRVKKSQQTALWDKIAFFIIALLLFVLATSSIFRNLDPVSTPITALQDTRQSLLALGAYNYETRERGSGYTITFEGYMSEGRLLGKIDEYNIAVYEEEGTLLIQQQNEEEWIAAEDVGLGKLSCFVMPPDEILELVAGSDNRRNITFKEEGTLVHLPHKTNRNDLVHSLFPGISSSAIKDFDIFIRLRKEGGLDSIEMALQLLMPDSTEEIIYRTISLKERGGLTGISYPDITR